MSLSKHEKKALYDTSLTDEYIAAVNRRAEVVHDFRCHRHDEDDGDDGDATSKASLEKVILGPKNGESEPIAFVIRNVLTPSECDDLIDACEEFGIKEGQKYVARSAKRTKNYINTDLSETVERRIKHVFDAVFKDPSEDLVWNSDNSNRNEKENKSRHSNFNTTSSSNDSDNRSISSSGDKYMGPFYGIHKNWRVLRYDADAQDAFPAHQDQMDGFQVPKSDGSGRKDLVCSSHTLLLQLSHDNLQGGCTRFYPKGKIRLPAKQQTDEIASFRRSQFDHAVDVLLPRGWALVFKQQGLLHAGQPLSVSSPCSKYVAQAGVLRVFPEGKLFKPSIFKNGPGVTNGAF